MPKQPKSGKAIDVDKKKEAAKCFFFASKGEWIQCEANRRKGNLSYLNNITISNWVCSQPINHIRQGTTPSRCWKPKKSTTEDRNPNIDNPKWSSSCNRKGIVSTKVMELHDLVIKNKNKWMHKNTSKIQDTLAIKIPMPKRWHFPTHINGNFWKYLVLAQNPYYPYSILL